jgi:hypothetical protein
MLLYLTLFSGLVLFILIRSLFHGLIQILVPPIYTVRSVETAGFICDSFVQTKRLVWLNGIEKPAKIAAYAHPHGGDECVVREYWVGSTLLYAKVLCLSSQESGELSHL